MKNKTTWTADSGSITVLRLTYGVLPTREQFDKAFEYACGIGGTFSFRNDERVGTCALTASQLWKELNEANVQTADDWIATAGYWASSVLGIIGIEWI